jgi:carbon-monoxide dehydrogenase large subunit
MSRLIGKPLPRFEDARFLTGAGRYVDDIALEGMLHAAVARSAQAHGKIRKIDTAAALALPGVIAVFTHADLMPQPPPIPIRRGLIEGFERFTQPPIAKHKVRYVGEPVALIVAQTQYIAEDALSLLTVEIDELPPVVDWTTATKPAGLLFEDHGTNIGARYSVERGAVDAAFRTADYRRIETFYCQRHTALPMETRGLLADWDSSTGKLTVWGATKVPFYNRRVLADMLALPEAAIDLIETDVGGGFGVRGEFYSEDYLIPFAARALGRPIKWIEDRREHLLATQHSREMSCTLAIACSGDGTILALRGEIFADMGAYIRTNGGVVPAKAAQFLPGPYHISNFGCTVNAYLTNKTPVGTYRGPGRFEANFFRERLLDMVAIDLGIDAAEFRRRNLVSASEMPYRLGRLVPYEGEAEFDTGDYHAAFERALAEIGWEHLKRKQGSEENGWYHGVGLACFVESAGAGPQENARIELRTDGVDLYVGSSTMGQGHETVFAQICGETLGLSADKVRVFHGSTTFLDEGFGTYASRGVIMGGNATRAAAENLIRALHPLAATALGLPNAEICWKDGRFTTQDERRSVALLTLAEAATSAGQTVKAKGSFSLSKVTFTYGTHAAYVAVDPRTGKVKLLDYVAIEDVGRAVNPLIVHGQAIGALVQGLGGAFLENIAYDENGQLLTGSLADYLMPTAPDFPKVRCFTLELAPALSNPLGVKGAGEGGLVAVGGAVANAVSAALRRFGGEVRKLPLSPSQVWRLGGGR